MDRPTSHGVSVVMTVRNDPVGVAVTLESLAVQERPPDEIVVVDGGSTDHTVDVIRRVSAADSRVRLIEAPGTNIARGRNIAVDAARGDIIACIDAGCCARSGWLGALIGPFEADPGLEFVAGFYRIEPRTLFEAVVGLATMRGQLEPVDPVTFNPSARSIACTRNLWRRVGGWPEWLGFSEDTLFDHKVRRLNARWHFAPDAVVDWRPRTSLRAVARQFYAYGTGRGQTQIDAASYMHNLRNVLLLVGMLICSAVWPVMLAPAFIVFAYWFVWSHHRRAMKISRHTGRWLAYPLTVVVMWTVQLAGLAGYLVGTWQRWRDRERYRARMDAYLAVP